MRNKIAFGIVGTILGLGTIPPALAQDDLAQLRECLRGCQAFSYNPALQNQCVTRCNEMYGGGSNRAGTVSALQVPDVRSLSSVSIATA